MKTKAKRIREARQKFDKSIQDAHKKLKKDLHKFVRDSAKYAEKKLDEQEAVELKNMETELEKPELKEENENPAKFSFSQKF